MKRDLQLSALLFGGLALTYVPGDNYAALRFLGTVAYLGVMALWGWEWVRDSYRWMRTHTIAESAGRAVFTAAYYGGGMWLWLGVDWFWPLKAVALVAWLCAVIFVTSLVGAAYRVHREARS